MQEFLGALAELVELVAGNYLIDALTVVGLGVVCIPVEFIWKPNHRLFRLDDPSIQFPMTEKERVPNWLLVVLSCIIPAIAIFVLSLRHRHKRNHTVVAVLGFAMAITINMFITGLVKLWIGNTRPDLISRCIPADGTPLHQYVSFDVCTNPNTSVVNEGFRSTPSGHSSTSFCGLGFFSLWISGQFGLWRGGVKVYKVIIGMLPLVVALYIAVSRIADYRHHWFDVLLGAAFGFTVAYLVYFHYYPSVKGERSDVATSLSEQFESDSVV